MEEPVEVRPPASDRIFIVLGVEESRDHVSLTPLDHLRLDLSHGPAIERSVSESPGISAAGPTNVVSCLIASDTG